MEENENTFKSVNIKKTKNNSFFKGVILPFISGTIGACLVVGICFGVPQIREKIFDKSARN